ncbi:MAG: hypothetical protein PHD15_04740 [Clostridia bacterium]|nr:hypothetical protein [Clostridia bacterium]MDD4387046.1 hypothetical protein [Clostridia bacterium]
MASSISYELFQAKQGVANGLATLDGSGKVLVSQLPPQAVETYKGVYATSAALILAHASALLGDYAYVTETTSYWYWNDELAVPAWVNQQITEAAYNLLSAAEQAAVPYIVEP